MNSIPKTPGRINTGFVCVDCGNPIFRDADSCTTGYATPRDSNEKICFLCADKRQLKELTDRSQPFTAYVSSDGNRITTWTGGKLMDVVQSRPCQLTRHSYTHDRKSYRSIRAMDVHGGFWHGRGSAGIAITLRASKT